MVADDARPSPATRPQARHHAFPANPGLVLEPHLHRARRPARPERRTQPRHRERPEPGPERRPRPRIARGCSGRPETRRNLSPGAAGKRSRPHKRPRGLLERPANVANAPPSHAVATHVRTRPRTTANRPSSRKHAVPPRGRSRRPLGPSALSRRNRSRTAWQSIPPDRRPPGPKPPSEDARSAPRPSPNAPACAKPPGCASSVPPRSQQASQPPGPIQNYNMSWRKTPTHTISPSESIQDWSGIIRFDAPARKPDTGRTETVDSSGA